ncbi:MAG: M20/M25/M40 family metallo-hydrolase [Acidobacteria bacterium]|nr:M20/M25/M40 family metallo-hydrolase [Acidobacteriota bacterium]
MVKAARGYRSALRNSRSATPRTKLAPMSRRAPQRISRRAFQRSAAATAVGIVAVPGNVFAAVPIAQSTLERSEARREELVELLKRLVAVRSQSGESAEEAQAIVTDYLGGLPYSVEPSADVPSRLSDHPEFMPPNPPGDGPFVNVVAVPRMNRPAPFGVFAHIDTEAVYDGWTTDPYAMTRVGKRLYGLGSADDKGGIAAMLVAASILAEQRGPLPTVMSLHGKGGGSRGSLPVFERFARRGTRFDAMLYSHPAETGHGLADVKNVVQGSLDLTLEVTGWRGEPLEMGGPESAPYDTGGDAVRAAWSVIERLRQTAFAGQLVNAGEFRGGDRVGAVPETARARIRVLFEGDATWRELLANAQQDMDRHLADLGGEPGYSGTLVQDGLATNFGAVRWDSTWARGVRDAIGDVTGTPPNAYPNHYAGDIRYPIRLLDAPAFGIGSLGGNFYGPNEWVDEDDLVRLVAVIVETMHRWAA